MKKYLIGFIIAIVSIIPISNVKALTGNDGVEYPDKPNDGHTQFIIGKENGNNEIMLYTFSEEVKYFVVTEWKSNSGGRIGPFFYASGVFGDWDGDTSYKFSTKEYILKNGSWSLNSSYTSFKSNTIAYMTPLYSTMDIYFDGTTATSLYPDGYYYISGEHTTGDLVYSANVVEAKEYMTFSANFANDLDGLDIYMIRFNAINYNSEYQYLIKTYQETEWTDITEELNNEANQYDYMLYYNTTLYMQVLDAENNILETKTYTVSDLTDYGLKITHGDACDLSGRYMNLITIDTRYIYSNDYKYQYSYDNQVFYDMDITQDNKIYYLFHALDIPVYFRILNAGETIVHEQVYNGDFSNVEKNVLFFESTDVVDNQKQIIIQVDFTEYLKFYDMYNFRIWVNDIEYNEQTFALELILTEKNYINAIAIKIQVDNLIIEDFTHRIGTINGTSGGSDTDFNGMYNNAVENELENELKEQDYSTIPGMIEAVKSFIKATGEFITTFFELIMYFFNKLNIWIRTCIIALFIELIIFKTIKAVRK